MFNSNKYLVTFLLIHLLTNSTSLKLCHGCRVNSKQTMSKISPESDTFLKSYSTLFGVHFLSGQSVEDKTSEKDIQKFIRL